LIIERRKMKTKLFKLLMISLVLILSAITAFNCAGGNTPAPTQTTQPTQTAQPSPTAKTTQPTQSTPQASNNIRAINPTGLFVPVQTKPLAPRLDKIDGKTIYVCQGEADPVIMPALYKRLVKDYPGTKFIYYDRSDFGPNVPGTGGVATSTNQPEDPDILKKVDAVIRGNGW
jgi:hypothetical protein